MDDSNLIKVTEACFIVQNMFYLGEYFKCTWKWFYSAFIGWSVLWMTTWMILSIVLQIVCIFTDCLVHLFHSEGRQNSNFNYGFSCFLMQFYPFLLRVFWIVVGLFMHFKGLDSCIIMCNYYLSVTILVLMLLFYTDAFAQLFFFVNLFILIGG